MKRNFSAGAFILQILVSVIILLFVFFYFDPFNELNKEADSIHMLAFGLFLPVAISVTVFLCLLIGLPLRLISRLRIWWLSKPLFQLILLAVGLCLLLLSINVNFKISQTILQNGEEIIKQYSNTSLSFIGWAITAFTLLHLNLTIIIEYFSEKFSGKSDWIKKNPD